MPPGISVRRLCEKNTYLRAKVWEEYYILRAKLLQMKQQNDLIEERIIHERSKNFEIIENYSIRISRLEKQMRNITGNYKLAKSKKSGGKRRRHANRFNAGFNELEAETKIIHKDAEDIFRRVTDPRELRTLFLDPSNTKFLEDLARRKKEYYEMKSKEGLKKKNLKLSHQVNLQFSVSSLNNSEHSDLSKTNELPPSLSSVLNEEEDLNIQNNMYKPKSEADPSKSRIPNGGGDKTETISQKVNQLSHDKGINVVDFLSHRDNVSSKSCIATEQSERKGILRNKVVDHIGSKSEEIPFNFDHEPEDSFSENVVRISRNKTLSANNFSVDNNTQADFISKSSESQISDITPSEVVSPKSKDNILISKTLDVLDVSRVQHLSDIQKINKDQRTISFISSDNKNKISLSSNSTPSEVVPSKAGINTQSEIVPDKISSNDPSDMAQGKVSYSTPSDMSQGKVSYSTPNDMNQSKVSYSTPNDTAHSKVSYSTPSDMTQGKVSYSTPNDTVHSKVSYSTPSDTTQGKVSYSTPSVFSQDKENKDIDSYNNNVYYSTSTGYQYTESNRSLSNQSYEKAKDSDDKNAEHSSENSVDQIQDINENENNVDQVQGVEENKDVVNMNPVAENKSEKSASIEGESDDANIVNSSDKQVDNNLDVSKDKIASKDNNVDHISPDKTNEILGSESIKDSIEHPDTTNSPQTNVLSNNDKELNDSARDKEDSNNNGSENLYSYASSETKDGSGFEFEEQGLELLPKSNVHISGEEKDKLNLKFKDRDQGRVPKVDNHVNEETKDLSSDFDISFSEGTLSKIDEPTAQRQVNIKDDNHNSNDVHESLDNSRLNSLNKSVSVETIQQAEMQKSNSLSIEQNKNYLESVIPLTDQSSDFINLIDINKKVSEQISVGGSTEKIFINGEDISSGNNTKMSILNISIENARKNNFERENLETKNQEYKHAHSEGGNYEEEAKKSTPDDNNNAKNIAADTDVISSNQLKKEEDESEELFATQKYTSPTVNKKDDSGNGHILYQNSPLPSKEKSSVSIAELSTNIPAFNDGSNNRQHNERSSSPHLSTSVGKITQDAFDSNQSSEWSISLDSS